MKENQFKEPVSSIKSPELTLSGPSRCTKPKRGYTPFFSKYRSNFLDVDINGNTQKRNDRRKNPMIENIRRNMDLNHKSHAPITKPVEYYEVIVKNGEISRITQKRNKNGKKSNKFISREGFSMKMLGLLKNNGEPKPDGSYIV